MSNRREVRDRDNMPIGYVDEVADRALAIHYTKGLVGQYVKGSNITLDRDGRIFGYGDHTSAIILVENERR